MRVKVCKVKEKDIKSWWRFRPRIPNQNISQKESLTPIFSIGVIRRLWFGDIIIGDRYEVKKSFSPSFTSSILDFSLLLEEGKKSSNEENNT